MRDCIAFVSTMDDGAWGGSEELWSRAALSLGAEGFKISASVVEWSLPHQRTLDLANKGIDVWFRPRKYSLLERALRKATSGQRPPIVTEVEKMLAADSPSLVVFSAGGPFPWYDLMELVHRERTPFVTVGQANWEWRWLADEICAETPGGARHGASLLFRVWSQFAAREKHLGGELTNGEVVLNPFNVDYDVLLPWPRSARATTLRLACVARLDPNSKGQDLLLEALAHPVWAERKWRLTLYGDGQMRDILQPPRRASGPVGSGEIRRPPIRARRSGPTTTSWSCLSRFEGLPLAMVEAMLCGRPVLATDVAGHADLIDDEVTGFLAEAPTMKSVAQALERLWARREHLEQMGRAGAEKIRKLVPRDPAQVFAEKLKGHLLASRFGSPADGLLRMGVQ